MKQVSNLIWQAKFEKKKNWLKAINLLEEAGKIEPKNKQIFEEIADIYLQKKLYSEAIEYLQKVLEIDPANSNALFRVANAYLTLGENTIAIRFYKRIKESFPEASYNLAIALNRIGEIEDSIAILEKILGAEIISELPYFFLVEQYLQVKRYKDAIYYLDITEKKFGKQGKISFLRGLAYYNLSNWLKAYIEFYNANKLNYNGPNFLRAYGITCEKIGKSDKAIKLLKENIRREPYEAFIYVDLINILLKNEKITEAKNIAELATKFIPQSSAISLLYNKIIDKLNKLKE